MAKRPPQHVPHYARVAKRAPESPAERAKRRQADRERAQSPIRKLYRTKAWREARKEFLEANPVCIVPGCGARANVVDHRKPHRGDVSLFWDRSNWDPMCDTHHNSKTARFDGGFGNKRQDA